MAENLTNKRFGKLVVLERAAKPTCVKDRGARWKCSCECGNVKTITAKLLKSGDVKSCGCLLYKGYKDLSSTYFTHIKTGARLRNFEFNVTYEYLWELYESQGRICALSGESIYIDKHYGQRTNEQTASLDRIDSSKGYVVGNVQWVHKVVNGIKSDMRQEDFIAWCKKISDNS